MTRPPRLQLFGGFSLSDENGASVTLTLRKTEALIGYLAVSTSRSQQRELVATTLWSESTQAGALQSLRQARLTLMRNLEAHNLPIIRFSRREISLDEKALEIDVAEFMRLQSADDQDSLARGVDLYRGDFLAGLEIDSESFNEWLQQTRRWYRERVEAALGRLLTLQEQAGAQESAIRSAKRILALDPLREDMYRWLMCAFAGSGQRTSALATYEACRTLLQEELGVAPEPETEELHQAILRRADLGSIMTPATVLAPGQRNGTALSAMDGAGRSPTGIAHVKPALAPISNLSNSALTVLRLAAICAGHFSRDLLDAIHQRTAEQCNADIRELQRAGLLQWDEAAGHGVLHDTVRERVLDQVLPSHLKHLHYAVAVALEHLAGPDGSENSYEMAEHYRKAAKWPLAVTHQLRLVEREIDSGHLEAVEPLLKRAFTDLTILPIGEEKGRLELDALLLQANLAELRGDLARLEESLNALWPALKRSGSGKQWITALLTRSRLRSRKGQTRRAFSAIRLIPQSCKGGPMESFWLLPERFATFADAITAEIGNPATLQQLRGATGPRSGDAELASLQALCQAKREKFSEAYAACSQAIQISEDLPDPTCLIVSLQALATTQVWDGEAVAALTALDRARALAERRGDLLRQYTTHGYRGFALMNAGRPDEAVSELQLALEMSGRLKLPFMAAMFSAWLAGALVDTGATDQALEVARKAVHLASERNEPWARSVALRFLGQALASSAAEDVKLINRILRSAQEIQSGLGLPFETARTITARNEIARAVH